MSLLNGTDTYQGQLSTLRGALPAGRLVSGDKREFFGVYTTTGSETSGYQIPIVQLPVGAIVNPSSIRICAPSDTGGSSVVISKIGDATTDNRYSATSVTLTGGTNGEAFVQAVNAIAITRFPIDTVANSVLLATMTHSGAPTSGKKVAFRGEYLLP